MRSAKRTARTNEVRAVLRRVAPHKGLHPLHRLRIYPRELCSGNNLLSAGSYRRKVGKIPYRQPGRLLRSRRSFPILSIHSICQEVCTIYETEIEKLKAEKIFALPDVKGLLTEAVNEHNFNPSWVYRPG